MSEHLSWILEALINIDSGNIRFKKFGIVLSVENYIYTKYRALIDVATPLSAIWRAWPGYSDKSPFPGPMPEEEKLIRNKRVLPKDFNMWIGKYGEQRKELVKFLISNIEKDS